MMSIIKEQTSKNFIKKKFQLPAIKSMEKSDLTFSRIMRYYTS
jgi:hypothetical protein